MINKKTKNFKSANIASDDAMYTLYLQSKLKKSQDDIKNGRVMTIEASKERMRKKYAGFDVK